MPGIAGIISPTSPDECERMVGTMVASMRHRGDCTYGTRFAPELGVFGGWVAHPGSFAERQSTLERPGNIALLLSGECFPDAARASRRPHTGVSSDGRDAGSLLQQYSSEGIAFVAGLNGLFSGLLIDAEEKRAFLFNDRYGSERLYHFEKGDSIYFASEAKALLAVLPELRALDDRGVADFLLYGSTLQGRTLFRNVSLLPGAAVWTFEPGSKRQKRRYFLPEAWESQTGLDAEAFHIEFADTFRNTLPSYLDSPSRIGISITGGLDTRMIMACAVETGIQPVCYTFAGLAGDTLDAKLGARVADVCGLEHHTLRIGQEFLANFGRYLDETVYITDGCAGVLGAHEIYLTRLARQLAPVRVTGNFGSEILRSMSTFKPVPLAGSLLNPSFRETLHSALEEARDHDVSPVTHAAFREIPWHLFGTFSAARSQLTLRTPYLDNEIVRLAYRAPASSRQSPDSALRLINDSNHKLGRIPTDRGLIWGQHGPTSVLRRLFCEATFKLDYLHKEGLPGWLTPVDPMLESLARLKILGLHKFLPYRTWFRRELASYAHTVLTELQSRPSPYWSRASLAALVADHVHGRRNALREIHAVITLEAVERLFVRDCASLPGSRVAA